MTAESAKLYAVAVAYRVADGPAKAAVYVIDALTHSAARDHAIDDIQHRWGDAAKIDDIDVTVAGTRVS